jgi:hypothetical protein
MRTCVRVAHPPYLREKARELRTKNKMSLNEIAECLALGKTTVWYWIRDLPDPEITYRDSEGRRRGREAAARANRERFQAERDRAYRQGWAEFRGLDAQPGFRDFVCIYIGEGYKRSRNVVSVANSNPGVILLANHWIRRFARNPVTYQFQYHADQDPDQIKEFWCGYLDVDEALFTYQRKSNSGQLSGRKWRSTHGVLTVRANDTLLRARVQAWIDRVHAGWLDSIKSGCSSAW